MTVYVDKMKTLYGHMIMSHMMADTTEELLAMADQIKEAAQTLAVATAGEVR